jgi:Tol biopolymer transport system component
MKNIYIYTITFLLLLFSTFDCAYTLLLEYPDFSPDYSSDGKSLIFDVRYMGNAKIFIYNKDIDELSCYNINNVYEPSISKNLKLISYIKNMRESRTREVFIMKSNETEIKQLTKNNLLCYNPLFSNDGQKIFFGMKPKVKSVYQWYSVEINTSEQKIISEESFLHSMNPGITPDDKYLIFADTDLSKMAEDIKRMEEGRKDRIEGYDLETEKIVRLEISTGKVTYLMFGNQIRPVVTKNGDIIFSGEHRTKWNYYGKDYPEYEEGLYRIDINGNNFQQILSAKQINELLNKNIEEGMFKKDYFDIKTLRLSPDEKYIFFESGNHKFYEVSLDGKEKREIVFDKEKIVELFNKSR